MTWAGPNAPLGGRGTSWSGAPEMLTRPRFDRPAVTRTRYTPGQSNRTGRHAMNEYEDGIRRMTRRDALRGMPH
jgi:hypothetical protein